MQFGPRRRRVALNEAVHELRRPLQILALAVPGPGGPGSPAAGTALGMATAALERLEREINGEAATPPREPLAVRSLLEQALTRWRPRAARDGAVLVTGPVAEAVTVGDPDGLARALDNLIANALEHGGQRIDLAARVVRGELLIVVRDRGRRRSPRPGRGRSVATLSARFGGRRRRGHGLRVVRRIAAGHGGGFQLRSGEHGTEAALRLPLAA